MVVMSEHRMLFSMRLCKILYGLDFLCSWLLSQTGEPCSGWDSLCWGFGL
jgi:hypothetical protein